MTQNLTGTTLADRYRFETMVGQGTFAQVYRVHDLRRNVDLAAKVLREDVALEPSFVERFRREASVLSRLQHPYIVRYYDTVEISGIIFILMDYIAGTTLQAYLYKHSQPMTLQASVQFVRPVTSALAYAHGEGVIHRDIKPGNILIADNGQVYVTDFGIARLLNESSTLTRDLAIGTPLYMAPEQILNRDVSVATDVYALGVVLYQMYTGQVPFSGNNPQAVGGTTAQRVAYEHLNLPPVAPSRLNSALPPEVDGVLLKALAKEPAARFPNVTVLYDALMQAGGITPKPLVPETPTMAAPPTGMNPPEWSRVGQVGTPPGTQADQYSTIPPQQPGQPTMGATMPHVPRPTVPSQPPSNMAATMPGQAHKTPARGTPVVPPGGVPPMSGPEMTAQTMITQGYENYPPPGTGTGVYRGGVAAPDQSYDPTRRGLIGAGIAIGLVLLCIVGIMIVLALSNNDGDEEAVLPNGTPVPAATGIVYSTQTNGQYDIYSADRSGGNPKRLTTGSFNDVGALFSPNGRLIAYYSYSGLNPNSPADIWIMNPDGSNAQKITNTTSIDEREIAWSPDSTRIAYQGNSGGNYDIFVYDLNTKQTSNITNSTGNEYDPAWSLYNEIAFHSDQGGNSQIYAMKSDGSNRRQVTNGGSEWEGESAVWSPDASRIIFNRIQGSSTELYAISPNGGGIQSLFEVADNQRFARWVNGYTLIYMAGAANNPAIYTADFQQGRAARIINGGAFPDSRPN